MAVTIRDVAKQAGVSPATVSMVLNGKHAISQPTRERVLRAIAQMQYTPNGRARSFAQKATHQILFLSELERNIAYQTPHTFEIMVGMERKLQEKGYSLLLEHATRGNAAECVEHWMGGKLADGVVLHASVISKRLAAAVAKSGYPHVVIGQPAFESQVCWIDTNHQLAGEVAAQHLLHQGYRKIAFLGVKEGDRISQMRFQGFCRVLEAQEMNIPPQLIGRGDATYHEGIRMTRKLLDQHEPIDAILCASNPVALGCLTCLQSMDVLVPQDVGLMTFDNYPFPLLSNPQLSVVDINMYDMGKKIGSFIVDKIKKPSLQTQSFTTLPELLVRESTKKA